jgi:hypothetical protein
MKNLWFSIKYLHVNKAGKEVWTPLLSDWDLDTAILGRGSSSLLTARLFHHTRRRVPNGKYATRGGGREAVDSVDVAVYGGGGVGYKVGRKNGGHLRENDRKEIKAK